MQWDSKLLSLTAVLLSLLHSFACTRKVIYLYKGKKNVTHLWMNFLTTSMPALSSFRAKIYSWVKRRSLGHFPKSWNEKKTPGDSVNEGAATCEFKSTSDIVCRPTMLCLRILWTTGVNTSITTIDRGRSLQCCVGEHKKRYRLIHILIIKIIIYNLIL